MLEKGELLLFLLFLNYEADEKKIKTPYLANKTETDREMNSVIV